MSEFNSPKDNQAESDPKAVPPKQKEIAPEPQAISAQSQEMPKESAPGDIAPTSITPEAQIDAIVHPQEVSLESEAIQIQVDGTLTDANIVDMSPIAQVDGNMSDAQAKLESEEIQVDGTLTDANVIGIISKPGAGESIDVEIAQSQAQFQSEEIQVDGTLTDANAIPQSINTPESSDTSEIPELPPVAELDMDATLTDADLSSDEVNSGVVSQKADLAKTVCSAIWAQEQPSLPKTEMVDSEPKEQQTMVDSEPKEQRTMVDSEPKEQRTMVDSEPKEQRTMVDSEPKEQRTMADSEPKEQQTMADSEPKEQRTMADSEPKEQQTMVDSGTKEQQTMVDSGEMPSAAGFKTGIPAAPSQAIAQEENPFGSSAWIHPSSAAPSMPGSSISESHPVTWIEGTHFSIGSVVGGKYKIVEVLGRGGMGIVFKVEHLLLPNKKFFALKLLHSHLSNDEAFRKRFIREVEMAMEFTHEHAIQIRDFGQTEDGSQYFTMDYSTGRRLSDILKSEGALSFSRATNICKQVLASLKNAHAKGIVHRDLKPDNILIEYRFGQDYALVLDFGIAKIFTDTGEEKLTQKTAIGTPFYMSPEQASAEDVDMRTDLYSMGVILYQMITAKLPFTGSTHDVLLGHIIKPAPLPRTVRPDLEIPINLENIINKAMAKEKNQRYASAQAFIDALEKWERNPTGAALIESSIAAAMPETITIQPFSKRFLRPKILVPIVVALLLAIAGILFFIFQAQSYQKYEEQFSQALVQKKFDEADAALMQIKKLLLYQSEWQSLYEKFNVAKDAFALEQKQSALLAQQLQEAFTKDQLELVPSLLDQLSRLSQTQEQMKFWQQQYDEAKQAAVFIQQAKSALQKSNFQEAQELLLSAHRLSPSKQISSMLEILDQCKKAEEYFATKQWGNALALYQAQTLALQQLGLECKWDKIQECERNIATEKATELERQKALERKKLEEEQQRKEQERQTALHKDFVALEQALQEENIEAAQQIITTIKAKVKLPDEKQKLSQVHKQYDIQYSYHAISKLPEVQQEAALSKFLQENPNTPYTKRIKERLQSWRLLKTKKKQKELIALVESGKSLYEKKQYLIAQEKLEEYFADNGDELLAEKYTQTAIRYLGLSYYQTHNWEKAVVYLKKAPRDMLVVAYHGLSLYQMQDDSKALEMINRAWEMTKDKDRSLRQELSKAKIEILQRSFDQKKTELLETLQYYLEKFATDAPLAYMKKAGMLAKEAGKTQLALKYLQTYAKQTAQAGQEDKEALDAILGMQDFQPLQISNIWRYKAQKLSTQEISFIQFRVVSQENGRYNVEDNSGKTEFWYVESGYFFKGSKKIFPVPLSLWSNWDRDQLQVKVAAVNETIKTDAGEFSCVVLQLNYLQDPNRFDKEYYAPNVGEVRFERYRDGQKYYQRELVSYNVRP